VSISIRKLMSRCVWAPHQEASFFLVDFRPVSPFLLLPQFNRFWLDPENPESFPSGLLEALEELLSSSSSTVPDLGPSGIAKSGYGEGPEAGTAARLKAQMQADALRPLVSGSVGSDDEGDDDKRPLRMGTGADPNRKEPAATVAVWPEETLLQVGGYLQLSVSRFLHFSLADHPNRPDPSSYPHHPRLGDHW